MTKGMHEALRGWGVREGRNDGATDVRRDEERRGRMVTELCEKFRFAVVSLEVPPL